MHPELPFLADLRNALNAPGIWFGAPAQREDARRTTEEVVVVRRERAAACPEEHLPSLAVSLSKSC